MHSTWLPHSKRSRALPSNLRLKLGHQRRKVVDEDERELCEPAQGSSLQRCGKHLAYDRVI